MESQMTPALYKQKLLDDLYRHYSETPNALIKFPGSTTIVFGEGSADAKLMFIGEGPGQEEDRLGRPFVGRSGQLLNKLLEIAGLSREEVYIANIVKTRPPNNRKPLQEEITFSMPLLMAQIEIIKPKLVCTLGSSALQGFTREPVAITKVRGKIITINDLHIMPTYHPAYILRNQKELKTLADDILKASKYTK